MSSGRGVAQQARDQRVDHHALARARGARDQQVGHLGEVDGHRLAGDVAAEGERERRARAAEVDLVEDPPQRDDVELLVRAPRCRPRSCPGSAPRSGCCRAARAIARSSDSASIRLTLMCGAGWTSYWVTTGPALRPTIRASMSKLLSFSMIRASFHVWTASALAPAAAVGSSLRSSSSIGGSTHAIASRRAASPRRRSRRPGRGPPSPRPPSPARPRRRACAAARSSRTWAGGSGRRRARRRRRCRCPRRRSGPARRRPGPSGRGPCGRARPSRRRRRRPRPRDALRRRRPSRPSRCRRPASVRSWSVVPGGARGAGRGRQQRAQRHVEGDQQARDREPEQDHERARAS